MRVHFASHSQMSSFRDWNSTIKLLLTAGGGAEHLFYADFSRGGYWTEWGTHLQEKEKQMAGMDSEIKWKQQATTRAAALSLLSIPTNKIIVHIAQQLVVEKALNCMHGWYRLVKDYVSCVWLYVIRKLPFTVDYLIQSRNCVTSIRISLIRTERIPSANRKVEKNLSGPEITAVTPITHPVQACLNHKSIFKIV